MSDTIFYMKHKRREHFDAPQFTRFNQRYRGTRESEKINLEIQQFLFAIKDLSHKYSSIKDSYETFGQALLEGGAIEGVHDHEGHTIQLEGLNNLSARLMNLVARVESIPETAEALGRFTETFQRRF